MLNLLGIKTGPKIYDKVFFRVSHPAFPTALFLPVIAALIWGAQSSAHYPWHVLLGIFLLGLFLWTLVEYCLHRFMFHWTSVKEPWRTLASGLHMAHHRDPEEKSLIIAPPAVSLTNSIWLYFLLSGLSMSWSAGAVLLAGIFLGYILYEWVHFGAHEFQPKSSLGKYLKHYHLFHHFKHPKEVFGVTTPLWDHVFRTNM